MPKFNVNIAAVLDGGQQGLNFNIQLEANDYVEALEGAKPALLRIIVESGLIIVPAANGPVPAANEPLAPISGSTEG